VESNGSLPPGG